jgi:D-aminoacyl-tRNA deacylase
MRLVVQRVTSARVTVDSAVVAAIDLGILVLVGFGREDEQSPNSQDILMQMARKLVQVRLFPDHAGRFDRDVTAAGGSILAVSQFTLHADCRKGRRPSLHGAADPEPASGLFTRFLDHLETLLPGRVHSGHFGRKMMVSSQNWGPCTLLWDSRNWRDAA